MPKCIYNHYSLFYVEIWLSVFEGIYVSAEYLNCTRTKWGKAIESWHPSDTGIVAGDLGYRHVERWKGDS